MPAKAHIATYLIMALIGWYIVRHETMSQEIITSLVLIIVSIVAIVYSLRWLQSER